MKKHQALCTVAGGDAWEVLVGRQEEAPEGDYSTSNSKPRQINKTFALFYQNTHSTVDFKKSFENPFAELAGECYLQVFPKGNISKDCRKRGERNKRKWKGRSH